MRLAFFVILALIAAPKTAEAQEQRCTELVEQSGAECSCSEPFNASFDANPGNTNWVNATDSSPSSECGQGIQLTGHAHFPAGALSVVDEVGMPPGNNVSTVWRISGNGISSVMGVPGLNPDTRRVCSRYYMRLSEDYEEATESCPGSKFWQYGWDVDHNLQIGVGGCTNCYNLRAIWQTGWGIQNLPKENEFDHSICRGEWCRVEVCMAGDFPTGNGDFYAEGYIERVSDGARHRWPWTNMGRGTGAPMLRMNEVRVANWFRGGECEGHRDLSHAMQAEWSTMSPGTFIGAAYEIEGGDGPSRETLAPPGVPRVLP